LDRQYIHKICICFEKKNEQKTTVILICYVYN